MKKSGALTYMSKKTDNLKRSNVVAGMNFCEEMDEILETRIKLENEKDNAIER